MLRSLVGSEMCIRDSEGYRQYKLENDPDDLFNPGKLSADFPQSRIYTPSVSYTHLTLPTIYSV